MQARQGLDITSWDLMAKARVKYKAWSADASYGQFVSLPKCQMSKCQNAFVKITHYNIMLNVWFLKMGHSGPLFLYFHLFYCTIGR